MTTGNKEELLRDPISVIRYPISVNRYPISDKTSYWLVPHVGGHRGLYNQRLRGLNV